MASIGHLAVGVAAGRLAAGRRAPWAYVLFSLLSLLPDADVVAFAFHIPYAAPFGHRGAAHSLAFAGLCGLAAWAVSREGKLGLWAAATVATHPLLDALTDGGLGVALFWPLSQARFFAPWHPLPVAPIGAGMLSARGLWVVGVEAVLAAPLWWFAFAPGRRRPTG